MADPVLHLLAGPNGAGKSTLHSAVLAEILHLEFVNADVIAAKRWPGAELESAMKASRAAAERRDELLASRTSFVSETVFSHPSKVELINRARASGYLITLHVVAVPVELAVYRVEARVGAGGHDVPTDRIQQRWHRLWPLIDEALRVVDHGRIYDNSSAKRPYRLTAQVQGGIVTQIAKDWPTWLPLALPQGMERPS